MKTQIENIYRLSPMQEGMLLHALAEPEMAMYFEQLGCTLQGDLNIPAFRQAWQRVVRRHSVLRTSFLWDRPDKPLQLVHQEVEIPWEIEDWRELYSISGERLI